MASTQTIKIPPHYFVHVLDLNTNFTNLVEGPKQLVCQDHQLIVRGPEEMVKLAPKTYCIIENPVMYDKNKKIILDKFGQAALNFGDQEIRTADDYSEPFPLYPGEEIKDPKSKKQYTTILKEEALEVKVIRDYKTKDKARCAGECYLVYGPSTYIPRIEEQAIGIRKATIVKPNTAVEVEVLLDHTLPNGKLMAAGQKYRYSKQGSFLPNIYERVVNERIDGTVITDKKAILLRALSNFEDAYGVKRRQGDEWLVTSKISQFHIENINEESIKKTGVDHTKPIILSGREYCIVVNPISKSGEIQYGKRELKKGEATFFLQPGELLEGGVNKITVLTEEEALLLKAQTDYYDEEAKVLRLAGDRWLIRGPREFIPPTQVKIKENRKVIALDSNDGIYIHNLKNGEIRLHFGKTCLLEPYEVLWEKSLSTTLEKIIYGGKRKNKFQAVTYRAPDNAAIQIHDFKTNKSKVVLGPALIMLQPTENFSVLSLSGGNPVVENYEQVITVPLGQFSLEDNLMIETDDHAQLKLSVTYHCQFKQDPSLNGDFSKFFSVRDYIGDAFKQCASRIRGAVSVKSYDEFHHSYAEIVKKAVFGKHEDFTMPTNNLCILQVDVKSQEPVDKDIQNMLTRNTAIAIDVKTKAQEAQFKHKRAIAEQENKGNLDKQKIEDQVRVQESTLQLTKLKTEATSLKIEAKKLDEAKAEVSGKEIHAKAYLEKCKLDAETIGIEKEEAIDEIKQKKESEFKTLAQRNTVEVEKARGLAQIEVDRFTQLVKAIGRETLVALARAGPEQQARLLKSLGLQGYLVSDGKNPINLFNTAKGMVSTQQT